MSIIIIIPVSWLMPNCNTHIWKSKKCIKFWFYLQAFYIKTENRYWHNSLIPLGIRNGLVIISDNVLKQDSFLNSLFLSLSIQVRAHASFELCVWQTRNQFLREDYPQAWMDQACPLQYPSRAISALDFKAFYQKISWKSVTFVLCRRLYILL